MGAMASAGDVLRVSPPFHPANGCDIAVAAPQSREAAFVGRSNAGKSSLLNKLVYSNKLGVAAVSVSPAMIVLACHYCLYAWQLCSLAGSSHDPVPFMPSQYGWQSEPPKPRGEPR